MITEDYVRFETAKLLKENGFDAKCKYVWKLDKANDLQDTDGISKICAERFMEGKSFVDNSDIKSVFEYEGWLEDYHKVYLCPTLQMAMKWLREVHKVEVRVSYDIDKTTWYGGCNPMYEENEENSNMFQSLLRFDYQGKTYEEACEAAIKYCLENLGK